MNRQVEIIQNLTDKEVLFHLYLTQGLMLAVSGIAGFFVFDNLSAFFSIWEWNLHDIVVIGGGTALAVVILDFALMKFLPDNWYDDGGINEKVFQTRGIPHILFMSAVISLTEELLFRGVLQTQFGLVAASIIFALLHFRYLRKWVLFIMVFSLSFLLGWIFDFTGNLWVTVFAHFLIDAASAFKLRYDYLRENPS